MSFPSVIAQQLAISLASTLERAHAYAKYQSYLRTAIQAGDESGIAEGDVFERVRDYIKQLEVARKPNSYECARKRAMARLRKGSELHTTLPPSRDESHEH